MKLQIKSPKQSLNRLYHRENILPKDFEQFTDALDNYFYYINRAKSLSEITDNATQYLENLLTIFYPNFNQKAKSYQENQTENWVITAPENQKTRLLFKLISPKNSTDIISVKKPNCKALQELIIDYLWEKIIGENDELNHLIITNMEDFFLFDAQDLDYFFCEQTEVIKQFEIWKTKGFDVSSTDEIYDFLAQFIADAEIELPVINFNLLNLQTDLEEYRTAENKHHQRVTEQNLAVIYKLFAPSFLLKNKDFKDINDFDKTFYFELLHILGIEEKIESGKKIIVRCPNPNVGSLLENTIIKLRTEDLLYNLKQPKAFGKNEEERYFNVALDLIITWTNRVLFLKILEAQLTTYNNEDDDNTAFQFLHSSKITEFDTLNTLFFEVLAIPEKEREAHIIKQYNRIPYLNSSLFEVTNLERQTLRISNIKDSTLLPLYENSILKFEENINSLSIDNQELELPTLKYLLNFLDAYDFGLEQSKSIVRLTTKPYINTTILGLILEKINGYKEGAFYTPESITMNMARKSLRRLVVDKFKHQTKGFGLDVNSFEEVRTYCHQLEKSKDLAKANTIINSITVCDPAVGSGHFLVAALNELLAIKSDLGILCDLNGRSLFGKIHLKIEHDELIIYDNNQIPFAYKVSFSTGLRKLIPELQLIQETIFQEKKHLIEHCLFGVDINPNAVKICQLRLWIELLKNTHYRQGRNTQLETLPNIDINIKAGNSLVSRFALDADLKEVFRKTEYSVEEYKRSVKAYKAESNKTQKRKLSKYLKEIKSEFQVTFDRREREKISKVRGKKNQLELQIKYNKNLGYEPTKKEITDLQKFSTSLLKRETEKQEILSSDVYQNAFEWRFEFPEILDENGDFVGFDLVIGNPPYTKAAFLKPMKLALKKVFQVYQSNADLYIYFFELSQQLVRKNGAICLLTPNNWLHIKSAKTLRNLIAQKEFIKIIDYNKKPVFKDFSTTAAITHFSKKTINLEKDFSTIEINTLD